MYAHCKEVGIFDYMFVGENDYSLVCGKEIYRNYQTDTANRVSYIFSLYLSLGAILSIHILYGGLSEISCIVYAAAQPLAHIIITVNFVNNRST